MKNKATDSSRNIGVWRERGTFGRTGEVQRGSPDESLLPRLESRLFRCDGDKDPDKIKRMFTAGGRI